MATVADLLDAMSLLDNEFEVGDGDRQETIAILALKHAQHWFETVAAGYPLILQDTVTVSASANTETSDWPTSLLRVDGMQYLDTNGVPIGPMYRIEEIGGHIPNLPMPITLLYSPSTPGAPFAYYGNMRDFYWLPRPDVARDFRIYGFFEADEFTVRTDPFDYPNRLILPLATFATRVMQSSVGDDPLDMEKLSVQTFGPAIRQLRRFDRSAPSSRFYTEFHLT